MEITLDQAYRMARKYYRKKWTGRAQYHLSAIGEREDVLVISFFLFIPDPLYTKFLTYKNCELCHIRGIIPVYYDSNPKWIEVRKDTGDCREVLYKGHDWLFGPGKEYEESLTWSPRERLFEERIGKGKRFLLIKEEGFSSNSRPLKEQRFQNGSDL